VLEESSSEFVNIHSKKEEEYYVLLLHLLLKSGRQSFFFPAFCGHHLATIKIKACNSYKGFIFLKGIPQICQILRKEQFEIVI
jgi:hypothetical protein